MEPTKSIEYPAHYRNFLSAMEKIKVEFRVFRDKLALFTDLTSNLFNRKEELLFKNKLIQGGLPKDFDEVLMKTGDKYAPSQRLNNIAERWYKDDSLILGWVPNSALNNYFRQYHTYKITYRKLKAREANKLAQKSSV